MLEYSENDSNMTMRDRAGRILVRRLVSLSTGLSQNLSITAAHRHMVVQPES